MKQTKRTLAILLAVLLLALSMPFAAVAAESGTYQGFNWTLSDDGVLTISGEGELQRPNYERSVGWHRYRSQIKSVVVESGVTGMTGSNLFSNCPNLTSLSLPLSLTAVGSAFRSVSTITAITYEGTQEDWNQITGTDSIPNLSNIEIAVHIHVYDDPAEEDWEWTAADDSYTVTVTVTCSLCAESVTGHEKELTATVEQTAEVPAMHLENGSKTFTATATVGEGENAQTFTDTKTDTIVAEGHNYGEWIPEVPATCTSEGTLGHYYCSGCKTYFDADYNELETVTIEKEPHEWDYESDSVTYTWDGFTACKATVPCKNCTETNDVTTSDISSETTTAPTCQATGIETYTAVFEESEALLAETTDDLPMIPHTFVSDPYFAEEDGTWKAFGTCKNHPSISVIQEATWKTDIGATCTEPEKGHYEAVINGQLYTDIQRETGDPRGHDFQFASFVWADDNTTAQAKLVCSRCEDEKLETATVTLDSYEATCTENAYTVYTATYGSAEPESKTVTAENTKLGHKYDNGEAVYNNDNATHNKICDRCGEPSYPVACFSDAETGWSGNTATCTERGKEYRTCPVCDHQYERDTEALGHNYGAVTHFDPDSNNYVKAQVPCSRCDGITERKPVELSETPATCSKTGLKLWFVKFDNAVFNDEGKDYYTVKTETIPINPEAHDYAFKGFTWTDGEDGTATAIATFTCKNNAAHTETPDATVTKDENASAVATCTAAGKNVYTASVTFNGETYGAEETPHEVVLAKLPHTYGEPAWSWNEDKTAATATFTCANCDKTADGHSVTETARVTTSEAEGDTKLATCTEDGFHKNVATVTFDGKDYTDVQTITDFATGHTYGEPEWAWEGSDKDGYTKATVTFTCTVDTCAETEDGHKVDIECTEDNEKLVIETTLATHLVDGKIVYTATAVFGEKEYTDAKEVQIKAERHTAETVEAVPAACTEPGNKAYTFCTVCDAILTIDGEDVEARNLTKTGDADAYTIPATGHTYALDGENAWTWTEAEEGGYTAAVNVKCENCNDTQSLEAEVKLTEDVAATHLEDGHKTYTATATIGEGEAAQVFTSTKTDKIPAEGHTPVELPAIAATCTTDGRKKCTYCSKCNVILAIDDEDVEENGYDMTDDAAVLTIAKLGHDWSEWKYLDETYHQRSCTNDSENTHPETEKHEVDVKVIGYPDSLYPNVTTHYQEVEYCTVCGAVLEVLDEWTETAQHQHEYTSVVTAEPNCTYEGVRTFTCQICGNVVTESIATNGAHADADNDGYCDYCKNMMTGGDHCPQCGKIHNGGFGDRLTGFFHRIAAFFTRLFR